MITPILAVRVSVVSSAREIFEDRGLLDSVKVCFEKTGGVITVTSHHLPQHVLFFICEINGFSDSSFMLLPQYLFRILEVGYILNRKIRSGSAVHEVAPLFTDSSAEKTLNH